MDKKPDPKPPAATKAGMTSDSLAPKAMPMPACSPVSGQVPRMAMPMPHAGAVGALAVPSAARHHGPKKVWATADVMRMDGYPSGSGGMQARPIVAAEAAVPAHSVSPIGRRPPAMPMTGG